jgi:hypothetical protein
VLDDRSRLNGVPMSWLWQKWAWFCGLAAVWVAVGAWSLAMPPGDDEPVSAGVAAVAAGLATFALLRLASPSRPDGNIR